MLSLLSPGGMWSWNFPCCPQLFPEFPTSPREGKPKEGFWLQTAPGGGSSGVKAGRCHQSRDIKVGIVTVGTLGPRKKEERKAPTPLVTTLIPALGCCSAIPVTTVGLVHDPKQPTAGSATLGHSSASQGHPGSLLSQTVPPWASPQPGCAVPVHEGTLWESHMEPFSRLVRASSVPQLCLRHPRSCPGV